MIYFKKSMPEPEELAVERKKNSGKYAIHSVLMRLKEDFQDKCYICEYKNPPTINVEHLISHEGNQNLKFDWSNLFLACSHCNNIKSNRYNNILNCTNLDDDVENLIKIHINPMPLSKVEVHPLSSDERVVETADLLDKIYNGTTTMKKIESNYIRKALVKEILLFLNNLQEYFDAGTPQLREYFRLLIGEQLDSSSAFAVFKRWLIKENPGLMEEFSEFITVDYQTSDEVRTS